MKQLPRRTIVALSLTGLLGLFIVAWSANRDVVAADAKPAAAKPAAAQPPVAVEVATVQAVDFSDEVSAVGSLKARESVLLRPEVSGRVARIGFRDGALVNAGDLLIELDATIPDAELAQAEASLALAQATFRRNQELVAKKFLSQQALDASAAALQVQQAAVRLAAAKAGKMRIRAPFRGIVGLRDVSVGSYVKDGETLINLEDIGSLRVDFRLAETHLANLAVGQTLALSSDALPGRSFTARVDAIDPLIDATSRSLAVRARLDNPGGVLRPGMFVRVRLNFGMRQGVLMVPEEAVVPGAGAKLIRVVDGKAEFVPVRLGARRAAQVEVIDGVVAGDTIVRAGQLKLRPGASVRVLAEGVAGQ